MAENRTDNVAQTAIRNAFQAGVISRASKELVACHSFGQFVVAVTHAMTELGCSGVAKFTFAHDTSHIKFGCGLKSGRGCSEHIILNSEYVALIVDVNGYTPYESSVLKNTVMTFFDAMTSWLMHHSEIFEERIDSMREKMDVVRHLDSFTECLYRINENLLTTQQHVREDLLAQLIGAFPILGLQTDQENAILDIFNTAIERESKLLSSQVKQNTELRGLIERAIQVLLPDEPAVQNTVAEKLGSRALFF